MTFHPIHPPAPAITEDQHKIAYYKYLLDYIVNENLLMADMCRQYQGNLAHLFTPEEGTKSINRLLDQLFKEQPNEDPSTEAWERIKTFEAFKKQSIECFNDPHGGDCTAVAASCIRCWVEDLYGFASTVTWANKHEGHTLFHGYLKETK